MSGLYREYHKTIAIFQKPSQKLEKQKENTVVKGGIDLLKRISGKKEEDAREGASRPSRGEPQTALEKK